MCFILYPKKLFNLQNSHFNRIKSYIKSLWVVLSRPNVAPSRNISYHIEWTRIYTNKTPISPWKVEELLKDFRRNVVQTRTKSQESRIVCRRDIVVHRYKILWSNILLEKLWSSAPSNGEFHLAVCRRMSPKMSWQCDRGQNKLTLEMLPWKEIITRNNALCMDLHLEFWDSFRSLQIRFSWKPSLSRLSIYNFVAVAVFHLHMLMWMDREPEWMV